VCSSDLALDLPFARRRAAGERLMATCGGTLGIVRVIASSATSGVVEVAHPSGTPVRIQLELSPIRPARIQLYQWPS